MPAPLIVLAATFFVTFPLYTFVIMRVTHKHPRNAQRRALYALKMGAALASIADSTAGLVTYLNDVPSGIIVAVLAATLGTIAVAGFVR